MELLKLNTCHILIFNYIYIMLALLITPLFKLTSRYSTD